MDNQYFTFMPHPHLHAGVAHHHTSPLTINSPSILGGADPFISPLTTNSSSIFTAFNNHSLSYLSLLNSTTTTPSSTAETTNYLQLPDLPADSPQKMINAHVLEHQKIMKNEQIFEKQKIISTQILEQQKMINNAHFHEEQRMINAQILEEQKMMNAKILGEKKRCVENDEKLKKILVKKKKKKESSSARKRRQKIIEKNRYLQKLLPWVTKMDISTMYDETAKYIKFLQAQIKVLNSMPLYNSTLPPSSHSSSYSSSGSGYSSCSGNGGGVELLGKLSRQEVWRVMMNSPRVQTVLSRNGWCLYTAEQMEGMLQNKVAVTGEAPGDVLPSYLLDGMLWNYY